MTAIQDFLDKVPRAVLFVTVSRIRWVALLVVVVLFQLEGRAGAQFSPSGGALLDSKGGVQHEKDAPIQTAGYDKGNFDGFFIQNSNGQFRLNLGAWAQLRYEGVWRETPPAGDKRFESGFLVPQSRFFFEGKLTDRIEYHLRFKITDTGDFTLQVAYGGWNFKGYNRRPARKGAFFNLRIGRQFLAFTRENWMMFSDLLTTSNSAVNSVFAVTTVDGVQGFYGRDHGRMWFSLSNGLYGGGADFPNDPTSQMMIAARGESLLAGDDFNTFNDLVGRKGRAFGVLLGVASNYALSGSDNPAGRSRHSGQVTADLSVGGDGFQAMAYAMWTWEAVGRLQSQWGFVAQVGYFIFEPWQVFAQYSLVDPGPIAGLLPFNQLTLGTNAFPFNWTNRIKLTLEGALLFNPINSTLVTPSTGIGWLPADAGRQYYLRAQLQFGF